MPLFTPPSVTYPVSALPHSDCTVPTDRRQPCQADCAKYLDDPQLAHWYGQNMLAGYRKATAIPIGIANQRYPHGNASELLLAARTAPAWEERTTLLYIGMDTATNSGRGAVVAKLAAIPGAKATKERVSYQTYLRELANAKFVAAPPGNGLDTHRVWEVSRVNLRSVRSTFNCLLCMGFAVVPLPNGSVNNINQTCMFYTWPTSSWSPVVLQLYAVAHSHAGHVCWGSAHCGSGAVIPSSAGHASSFRKFI